MSKVYSNDDLIPEKRLPKSVVALEDRVFQRFVADTQFLQDTNPDTGQLEGPLDKPIRFKCRIADPGVVFKMVQIETVWRFTFRGRSGEKVSHDNIALVPEALIERAFKSVRVSLNGQNFLSIPLEKIHCEIANPILGVFPKDNGCMLPFRENSLRGFSFERNEGFETRARWFAEHKVQCDVADDEVARDVAARAGIDYLNVRVCFPIDCHALSSYQRGQEANMNTSIPFVYDMEICLFPNLDKSPGDYESSIKTDGTPFLKRIFRIGNPLAKVVLDRDHEFNCPFEPAVPLHHHVVTWQNTAGHIGNAAAITLTPPGQVEKQQMRNLLRAEQAMYVNSRGGSTVSNLGMNERRAARGITCFIGTSPAGLPMSTAELAATNGGVGPNVDGSDGGFATAGSGVRLETITRKPSIIVQVANTDSIFFEAALVGTAANQLNGIRIGTWITVVGSCLVPQYYFRPQEYVSFRDKANGVTHLPDYQLKAIGRLPLNKAKDMGNLSDVLFHTRLVVVGELVTSNPLADHADANCHMFKNNNLFTDPENLLVGKWLCTQKGKLNDNDRNMYHQSQADAVPRFNKGPITCVHGHGLIAVRVKDSSNFTSGSRAKLIVGKSRHFRISPDTWNSFDEATQLVINGVVRQEVDLNRVFQVVYHQAGLNGDIVLLEANAALHGDFIFDNIMPGVPAGQDPRVDQQDHFGGNSVYLIPASSHATESKPIISIDGRLTEEPTLIVEAITARDLKESYILDDFRNDVYKIEFGTKFEVGGNKINQIIRFDNLRLTEMPTKLYLFCKLRDEFCTTELMTSGISDMHLFMDQIEIRYMDKLVTQKNDQNLYWLYRTWITLNPGSNLDYESWRRYRFTLCLSPNEFCYPTFRSHVRRLGNIAISFVPRFTDVWKRFDKYLNASHNYLSESAARKGVTPEYSDIREPDEADLTARQAFLDNRVWEAQLVLVYNNKAIRMDSQGGMSRIENFSDTIEPNSGFKTSDARAMAQGGKNNVVQKPLDAWAM